MYDASNLERFPALGMLAPSAMKAFGDLDAAAMADGEIPVKYKELMAIAVALTTQCPYSLEVHETAARKAGATDSEIAETTFVAAALRAAAAVTQGTYLVGK